MDRDEFYAASSCFVGGGGEGVFGLASSEDMSGYFNSLPEVGPSEASLV
jgi:hypothetical protein